MGRYDLDHSKHNLVRTGGGWLFPFDICTTTERGWQINHLKINFSKKNCGSREAAAISVAVNYLDSEPLHSLKDSGSFGTVCWLASDAPHARG